MKIFFGHSLIVCVHTHQKSIKASVCVCADVFQKTQGICLKNSVAGKVTGTEAVWGMRVEKLLSVGQCLFFSVFSTIQGKTMAKPSQAFLLEGCSKA